jgi:hypothetical protein
MQKENLIFLKTLKTKFSQQLVPQVLNPHQHLQQQQLLHQQLLQHQLKLRDLAPLKSRILFVALKTNQICHGFNEALKECKMKI